MSMKVNPTNFFGRAKQLPQKMLVGAFNSKPWSHFANKTGKTTAAGIALFSATMKDAVQCVFYTIQAARNKEIPEDKRKFVASMDLVNGIVNVGLGGLIIGRKIKANSDKWYEKWIGGKATAKRLDELKKLPEIKGSNYAISLAKTALKEFKGAKGFNVIITLVASQVFAKRVLTPFISTPIATEIDNYANKRMKKKGLKPSEGHILDYMQIPAYSLNNTFRGFMDPTFVKPDPAAKTAEAKAK